MKKQIDTDAYLVYSIAGILLAGYDNIIEAEAFTKRYSNTVILKVESTTLVSYNVHSSALAKVTGALSDVLRALFKQSRNQ